MPMSSAPLIVARFAGELIPGDLVVDMSSKESPMAKTRRVICVEHQESIGNIKISFRDGPPDWNCPTGPEKSIIFVVEDIGWVLQSHPKRKWQQLELDNGQKRQNKLSGEEEKKESC